MSQTAPQTFCSVLDCVTAAGTGQSNEDTFDYSAYSAWVIDGVSGLAPTEIGNQTAPAWFARYFSKALSKAFLLSPEEDTLDLLNRAVHECQLAWDALDVDDIAIPAATFAMLRVAGGHIELTSIGDCSVRYHCDETGAVECFGDMSVEPFERKSLDLLKALQAEHPTLSHAELIQKLRPALRKNRQYLNKPDGYNVLTLSPILPRHCVSDWHAAVLGREYLLCSDGFTRFCDVLELGTSDTLYNMSLQEPLEAILKLIREREHTDEACRMFPRIKPYDDATALKVRIERNCGSDRCRPF